MLAQPILETLMSGHKRFSFKSARVNPGEESIIFNQKGRKQAKFQMVTGSPKAFPAAESAKQKGNSEVGSHPASSTGRANAVHHKEQDIGHPGPLLGITCRTFRA